MAGISRQDFLAHDGLGLADLVASRCVSPRDLLECAIDIAEATNPHFNFLAHKAYDSARAQIAQGLAAGPFTGVPFLTKDLNVPVAGFPLTNGSRAYAGRVSPADGEAARRFRRAGFVFMGVTTSPEFGLTTATESVLFGVTRNPWNSARTSGGSSGGAAAAVAAGVAPVAQASDGGGSIRIPASCCGLVGLKPSRGRAVLGGSYTEGWLGLSTIGAVTRSVRDTAAILDLLQGPALGARYGAPPPASSFAAAASRPPGRLRLAMCMPPPNTAQVHPEVEAAVRAAARLCSDLGHTVEELERLPVDGPELGEAMITTLAAHIRTEIDEHLASLARPIAADDVEPVTRYFYDQGERRSAAALAWANRAFQRAAHAMGDLLSHVDAIISPTLARPPVEVGVLSLSPSDFKAYGKAVAEFGPHTALHNQTGLPAISLPLAMSSDATPIGVMFTSRWAREELLIALAAQIESAAPWIGRLKALQRTGAAFQK